MVCCLFLCQATVPELQRLIPYCRAVSIKPWDWQKQLQTTVSEMFSFGEVSANKHCDNSARGGWAEGLPVCPSAGTILGPTNCSKSEQQTELGFKLLTMNFSSPAEMLACSERQLVRTYPKGVRFDSSNYDPIPLWNCGMHMVALNWQYPGTSSNTSSIISSFTESSLYPPPPRPPLSLPPFQMSSCT